MPAKVPDEALLLELLNTTPVVEGTPGDRLEPEPAGLSWLRAHGGVGSRRELAHVLGVRDTLQVVVRAGAPPSRLKPFLDSVSYRLTTDADGLVWLLETPRDQRIATRIVLAWDELRRTAPGRLRPCANHECALFLIDHSKTNSARWCSMAAC